MPTSEIVPWLQGTNHFLFVFGSHMRCVTLLPSTQRTAPALTPVYPWRLVPALYCRWRAFFLQTVTRNCLSVENKCLTVHRMSLRSPPRPRENAIWGWKIVGVREWRRSIFFSTWHGRCIHEHTAAMVSCIRPVLDWALSYFIMDGVLLLSEDAFTVNGGWGRSAHFL